MSWDEYSGRGLRKSLPLIGATVASVVVVVGLGAYLLDASSSQKAKAEAPTTTAAPSATTTPPPAAAQPTTTLTTLAIDQALAAAEQAGGEGQIGRDEEDDPTTPPIRTQQELDAQYPKARSGLSTQAFNAATTTAVNVLQAELTGENWQQFRAYFADDEPTGSFAASHQVVFVTAMTTPRHPELTRTLVYWKGKSISGTDIDQVVHAVYLDSGSFAPINPSKLPRDVVDTDILITARQTRA